MIQLIRFERQSNIQFISIEAHPKMDLEWLLPQQIEQILKFCDLSSIQDVAVAANLLEQHQWNLEIALNDLVQQNDHIKQMSKPKLAQKIQIKPPKFSHEFEEYNHMQDESLFELGQGDYHQLDQIESVKPLVNNRNVLAQQNKEYQQMEKSYIAKQAEEEYWNLHTKTKDQEYQSHKNQFENHEIKKPIQIKFRLPHKVELYTFDISDKVSKVFKYVSGHLREALQDKYSQFDLTQTFPSISLKDKLDQSLEEIFGESSGEVLIVKQL